MKHTKYILPVVAGVLSAMILQSLGEKGLGYLYPAPENIDPRDRQAIAAFMGNLPVSAFLLLLTNYIVCSVIAGVVATMITNRESAYPAAIAGIILTIAAIFNVYMLPGQPLWFSAISILVHFPFAMLGYYIVKKR